MNIRMPGFLLAAVVSGFALAASSGIGPRVGGPSTYEDIPGTAKIVKVAKTPDSIRQATIGGSAGYEGFEVRFLFTADAGATVPELGRAWAAREHLLQLCNSWYPGPQFIAKYGLKEGATFKATMSVIKSGVSTPVLFRLEGVDTIDYFERAAPKAAQP